jgi:hypothetical protein
MIGMLICGTCHYLGVLRYIILSDADARSMFEPHVYTNTSVTEKLNLCCGYIQVKMSKITLSRMELSWICYVGFFNCVSDTISCFLFFSHGQPFFGIFMIVSLAVGGYYDDLFGFGAGTYWCRSLKIGFPTIEILRRLAAGLNQSSISLVVHAMFFLNIKKEMEENGKPFLSIIAISAMGFSLVFTLLGMFVGSESMRRLEIINLYPKLGGDFDRRLEKFADKGRECLYNFYTSAVFLQRASIFGTIAFLKNAKMHAIATEYFLGMLIPALVIYPVIVGCFHCMGSKWDRATANATGLGVAAFELSGSLIAVGLWYMYGDDMMRESNISVFGGLGDEHRDYEALLVYYMKKLILYLTLTGIFLSPFNLVVVVVDIHRELFLSAESDPYEELYAAE